MNVYCISLRSAASRRAAIAARAGAASIEPVFLDAVEGRALSVDAVASYNGRRRRRYLDDMEANEIACTLSHRNALTAFLNDPYPYCVILEDDAVFGETLQADILRLVERITGFDIIKLECRSPRGLTVGWIGTTRIFLPLKASHGSTGILYSKPGAEKVLRSLDSFHLPFDTHLGQLCRRDFVCVACWPPLITEDARCASSIGGRRLSKRRAGIAAWFRARRERVVHSVSKRWCMFLHWKNVCVMASANLADPVAPVAQPDGRT